MTFDTSVVRRVESHDVPAIAALEKEIFSDAWSESGIGELLESENYTLLCCGSEDRVAGYAIFSHILSEGELLRVAVSPEHRRLGVGRLLINAFLSGEYSQPVEKVFLEVRSANEGAIALYKSLGFETIAKRRAYYKNPTDDALIMELTTA